MTQKFVTLPREVVERALDALDAGVKISPNSVLHDRLRAALDQPQNHVFDAGNMVTAGWKLVPVEPTRDMLINWIKADVVSNRTAPDLYRAMLAAAPHPPTVKESLTIEQPQANQPAMTPIAQRKLDSLLTEGYTISGYSVYHEQKHQHGFVTGAGLVGWWKPEGVEYPQPQGEQEPYAWHYKNNGGASVWHMGPSNRLDADIEAAKSYPKVHQVTPLYLHPQPKRDPLTEKDIQKLLVTGDYLTIAGLTKFARAVEAAHNIK